MELIFDKIKDTLDQEIKNINEKIKGASFLEILKNNILEQILQILDEEYKKNINEINENYNYEIQNRKLKIKLILKNKPRMYVNSKIENNLLIISYNDFINIDIEDSITKKYINLKLFPKKAITLPKNTICNLNYPKNVLTLEIYGDENTSDVENI